MLTFNNNNELYAHEINELYCFEYTTDLVDVCPKTAEVPNVVPLLIAEVLAVLPKAPPLQNHKNKPLLKISQEKHRKVK